MRLLIITLSLLLCPAVLHAQVFELQLVEFQLGGAVDATGGDPIERARLIVERTDDDTVILDRAFTAADGSYLTTVSAAVEVELGLDDPPAESDSRILTDQRWMGAIWPNPVRATGNVQLTLPYLAPESGAAPKLEMFDLRGRRLDLDETLASGVYLYRLRFGSKISPARKLTVVGRGRASVQLVPAQPRAGEPAQKTLDGVVEVRVRVEKAGYVTQQQVLTLDSTALNQVSFTMDPEPVPTASLSVAGTLKAGEVVQFDGTASLGSGELDYAWVFGDGQRGGGSEVAHVYAEPGDYTVELAVAGPFGSIHTTSTFITIVPADPPVTTGATVNGRIYDAVGNVLEGVEVTDRDSGSSATSQPDGWVSLSNMPTGVPLVLDVTKDGYTKQTVRLDMPANNSASYFETSLRQRRELVPVAQIEDGVFTEGEDGACVDLPPDALVKPDGSLATGPATVCITPIDVSNPSERGAFPGSYNAITSTGEEGILLTYGVMEVVFEQDGEELNLAPGRCADILIPCYAENAVVGQEIDLWSVDPSTGLWRQEGFGTIVDCPPSPTGLAMQARVTHFSWWNIDKFENGPYPPNINCENLPPGESCHIDTEVGGGGGGGPFPGPSGLIPPGGMAVWLPSNVDLLITGTSANGTLRGSVEASGPPGPTNDVITIPLMPIGAGGGQIVLPYAEEASIEDAQDVDVYSFEATADQLLSVVVSTAVGSTLEGMVTVKDPAGEVIVSGEFSPDGVASFAIDVESTGVHSVEVDGTANEPGAYECRFQFLEHHDLTPPTQVDGEMFPGLLQPFLVHAPVGTWMSVEYDRITGNGSGVTMRVTDPLGNDIYYRVVHSTATVLPFEILVDGPYLVEVFSTGFTGGYRIGVRDVPEILPGSVMESTLTKGASQFYRFTAHSGEFPRAIIEEVNGFNGSVLIVDDEGDRLPLAVSQVIFEGTSFGEIETFGQYFVWCSASGNPSFDDPLPFRVVLDQLRPPAHLEFDSAGRDRRTSSLNHFGDTRAFQFPAAEGSAVNIQVRSVDGSAMTEQTSFRLYRVNTGTVRKPATEVNINGNEARFFGDLAQGILQYTYYSLPADDTYVFYVSAGAPDEGEFELIVDYVPAGNTIVVDDDLVDDPGADTRSLQAAMVAAPAGATILVNPGTYSVPHGFVAKQPISVHGLDRDNVVLRANFVYPVLSFDQGLEVLQDLTIESTTTSQEAVEVHHGDSESVIQRITTQPGPGIGDMLAGVYLVLCNEMTVQDSEFNSTWRSVRLKSSNDCVVQNNVVPAGRGIIEVDTCIGTQILNNDLTVTVGAKAIDAVRNNAGTIVEGNQIEVVDGTTGGGVQAYAIVIRDRDDSGTEPESVVRGNSIISNRSTILAQLTQPGARIVIEGNHVKSSQSGGWDLLRLEPTWREEGKSAVVRNNVFDGVRGTQGIQIQDADYIDYVHFVNNSLRAHPDDDPIEYHSMILVDTANLTEGVAPVLFVNNVMQGLGGQAIGTSWENVSINGDYNLFSGFLVNYAGAGTSAGTNDITQVPQYEDDLLRLAAGSPGVDSGATSAQFPEVPAVDYSGLGRPSGAGVDRGAHER